MGKLLKRIAALLAVAVVALGLIAVLGSTLLAGTPLGQAIKGMTDGATTAAANAALDASGVKGKIEQELRSRTGDIAAATGLSEAQVSGAIDQLAIDSWSVTTLPGDAAPQGTYQGSYQGIDATVTTYQDPGYLTVSAGGQTVTLAVPESAQAYANLLGYL